MHVVSYVDIRTAGILIVVTVENVEKLSVSQVRHMQSPRLCAGAIASISSCYYSGSYASGFGQRSVNVVWLVVVASAR